MKNRGILQKVLLGALIVYLVAPMIGAALFAFGTHYTSGMLPDGYTLKHWADTFGRPDVQGAIWRTVLLATTVLLIDLVIVVPAAYGGVILNPRIRTVTGAIGLIPFALPWIVVAAGLQFVTAAFVPSLYGTFLLLAPAVAALCFPLMYWPVDGALVAGNARELHEASSACGAGMVTTLVRVIVPAIRPGILSGSLLVFAAAFGEFAVTQVLTGSNYETVSLWTARVLLGRRPGGASGLAVMTLFSFAVTAVICVVMLLLIRTRSSDVSVAATGGGPSKIGR